MAEMEMASSSRTIKSESLLSISRVEHTNEKCPRSKKLGLQVR